MPSHPPHFAGIFVPVLLLGCVASLLAAPIPLPSAAAQNGVTYAKEIRPIFEMNCFRCHGADRAKGEIRLDSLEAALKGGEDGKIILPGDSANSPLVLAVARVDERSAMPPIKKPRPGDPSAVAGKSPTSRALTPDEVGLIRAWIDQGAH